MGHRWLVGRLEGFVTLVDLAPVDNVPPRSQIFGAAVVVLQIVGVLPHVVAEDRIEPLRKRAVLVGRGDDLHIAVRLAGQPYPATAELLGTGIVELALEVFERTESLLDHVGNGTAGVTTTFGLHDLPEHGVIHVTAAIVDRKSTRLNS